MSDFSVWYAFPGGRSHSRRARSLSSGEPERHDLVQYFAERTVRWSGYAQSLTARPLKAMLTGPVMVLAWSFVRDDKRGRPHRGGRRLGDGGGRRARCRRSDCGRTAG
jgi:Cobalamin-independent synthase, Catalytic domain